MKQVPCFIIILAPFHFTEIHLPGTMNYRIVPGALFGFTVIKGITVFFHRVVLTLNK